MDKQSTDHKEETLVAMLASFRKEACYHDTFEEDFLRNFHLRKETDQAAHSAWKLLLEYETSAKDNQLKPDSHADKKPVSRVLIEM